MILPDYLDHGLDAVFCGTAAGNQSADEGHYFSHTSNKFWGVLYRTGLTSELLGPERDAEITTYGLGLTDLAKKHAGNDADLRREMYDIEGFEQKILKFAPSFVAFTSKTAAAAWMDVRDTRKIEYGLQDCCIGLSCVFVLPSPSGNAGKSWREALWHAFAALIRGST